jgi:hypothetical protein
MRSKWSANSGNQYIQIASIAARSTPGRSCSQSMPAHPYDYITVETANTIDALTHTDYNQIMTKAWGKEKLESGTAQTMAARDAIGNEMWVAVETVSKQGK